MAMLIHYMGGSARKLTTEVNQYSVLGKYGHANTLYGRQFKETHN